MKNPTRMPCALSRARAVRISATVVPLFMASRMRWLPLSAPIQASAQPAPLQRLRPWPRWSGRRAIWMVKGVSRLRLAHQAGELRHPGGPESEDVVGEPDVVRIEAGASGG